MQEQINALQDQVKKLEESNRQLSETVNTLADLFYRFAQVDKYYFDLDAQFHNNIILDSDKGTQIGTSSTQKLSFYGKTPVVQQAGISAPSGGATIDTESRTAITAMLAVFVALGLTA